MRKFPLAAAVAALWISAPAPATTVVSNYGITGNADGTFTISLDTNTSLFSLTALNLIIGGTVYTTANAGLAQSGPDVSIGGNASGVSVLDRAQDDFKFTFQPGPGGFNSFFDVFVEITPATLSGPATVRQLPEPASWAMMLLGFGAVGLAMRRRRTAAKVRIAD